MTAKATKLTPAIVRRALDERYGKDAVRFYRAREGYYYFLSDHKVNRRAGEIPSLMWYDLEGIELDEILSHVANHVEGR